MSVVDIIWEDEGQWLGLIWGSFGGEVTTTLCLADIGVPRRKKGCLVYLLICGTVGCFCLQALATLKWPLGNKHPFHSFVCITRSGPAKSRDSGVFCFLKSSQGFFLEMFMRPGKKMQVCQDRSEDGCQEVAWRAGSEIRRTEQRPGSGMKGRKWGQKDRADISASVLARCRFEYSTVIFMNLECIRCLVMGQRSEHVTN